MKPDAAKRLADLHRQLADEYKKIASEDGEGEAAGGSKKVTRIDKKRIEKLMREKGVRLKP